MIPETAEIAVNGARAPHPQDDLAIALRALETMKSRATLLRAIADTLGDRAYQWATLLLASGAWMYALLDPQMPRIVCAVLFTALTHAPTWFLRRKDAA